MIKIVIFITIVKNGGVFMSFPILEKNQARYNQLYTFGKTYPIYPGTEMAVRGLAQGVGGFFCLLGTLLPAIAYTSARNNLKGSAKHLKSGSFHFIVGIIMAIAGRRFARIFFSDPKKQTNEIKIKEPKKQTKEIKIEEIKKQNKETDFAQVTKDKIENMKERIRNSSNKEKKNDQDNSGKKTPNYHKTYYYQSLGKNDLCIENNKKLYFSNCVITEGAIELLIENKIECTFEKCELECSDNKPIDDEININNNIDGDKYTEALVDYFTNIIQK